MEVVGTRTTQALRSIRLAGVTVISAAMAATLACTTAAPSAQQTADTIYAGGDIVTVNDAQPTAEALAVKDGKILAVSTRSEVERVHKGTSTHAVDLAGGCWSRASSMATSTCSSSGRRLLAPISFPRPTAPSTPSTMSSQSSRNSPRAWTSSGLVDYAWDPWPSATLGPPGRMVPEPTATRRPEAGLQRLSGISWTRRCSRCCSTRRTTTNGRCSNRCERRCRRRSDDPGYWCGSGEPRPDRPAPRPDPRPIHPAGSTGRAEGAEHHSVAVPDAHVLLG